jgi:hypothetical protein
MFMLYARRAFANVTEHYRLATLAAFFALLPAHGQPMPLLEHERDMHFSLFPPVGELVTRWSGRLLLGLQYNQTNSPVISAGDADEHVERILFDVPGASIVNIWSVGGGFDKSIAVGGDAVSADSRRAGFVAWISPDRQQRKIIQTEPFRAQAIVLDAKGIIWAAGHIIDGETGSVSAGGIVRRYSADGGMLSSIQVREADGTETSWSQMSSVLMASKNRVGWLTASTEYVEFTLGGAISDRFQALWLGDRSKSTANLLGWGLSWNNDVILEKLRDQRGLVEVLALDRARGAWIPVSLPAHSPQHPGRVLGFDRVTLVLAQQDVMERLAPPAGSAR